MSNTGFTLVDGAPSRGIPPATARAWYICAALVIAAQWVLEILGTATNYSVRLLNFAAAPELVLAITAVAWMSIPCGLLALLVVTLSKRIDGRGWAALGIEPRALTGALPWIIAGIVASAPAILMLFRITPGWSHVAAEALVWLTPATLVQSACEEILFRGALLTMLVARYGAARGVLISAALFALWHVFPGQGLVDFGVTTLSTFVFGVTSAILVLHQGHLGGAIALHLVWNIVRSLETGLSNWSSGFGASIVDFWDASIQFHYQAWTWESLQSSTARSSLVLPLALETLIILAACRPTFQKIFGRPELD